MAWNIFKVCYTRYVRMNTLHAWLTPVLPNTMKLRKRKRKLGRHNHDPKGTTGIPLENEPRHVEGDGRE